MTPTRTNSPVLVVGTGLLGSSVGLGLRRLGVDVLLADASPVALGLAADYGAGRIAPAASHKTAAPEDTPRIVVVCVPPDVAGEVVVAQLENWPDAIVTDVTSVKSAPLEHVRETGADLSRYVGSHPMAGRETGGPLAGRADLFTGRPWVVASHEETTVFGLQEVEGLALDLGSNVVSMTAEDHDDAVALISHVPQLLSTAMAERLLDDVKDASALAGGGLRDVTRIAASDPTLWSQILAANGPRVARILRRLAEDVVDLAGALEDMEKPGARRKVAEHMLAGNEGVARIPGKHGSRRTFTNVTVMIDDRPGQLARLFVEIGEAGINVEELDLEHSPGANIGLATIAVLPEVRQKLLDELDARGWKVAQ
ncbi:prephenate dehydrogenase [Gulosibacter chungangensis]|uniref:Prephenate dehydrogenase n=1 Tax=Gulosibacter chungangensis TaxID=979746 RepID=A0A7J5BCW2_9MICO|nr:prephenate dehydrogenase [Gulosibacter chungangensis]KAB1643882.1 prephenate dehydrogenase [Gulosibacter chungangensis]